MRHGARFNWLYSQSPSFPFIFHISTSFIIFDVHVECDVKQAGKISCEASQVHSFIVLEIWLMRPVELRGGEVGRKGRAS